MKKETKEVLEKLKKSHSDDYFLMQRFYRNPSEVLGGNEEKTIDEYYKYGEIKKLVFNQNFFDFLETIFKYEEGQDVAFIKKLDMNLLRKICFILFDTKDFGNMEAGEAAYLKDLEDEYLRNWCKNLVPLGEKYSKKYNNLQLYGISCIFKKYGWLYELGINEENIKSVNRKQLYTLIDYIRFEQDIFYEKYIQPKEQQEMILLIVKNDDYSDGNTFLQDRDGSDKKSFNALVCCNEFLDIVENELLEKELGKLVIKNIIHILSLGIGFKTRTLEIENSAYYYEQLGEERVLQFQHLRAEKLITLLNKKLRQLNSCYLKRVK